jgi:hypothetical protein
MKVASLFKNGNVMNNNGRIEMGVNKLQNKIIN